MEIYSWLSQKEHKNEFILLHINDEGGKSDWNHIALIQKLIKNIFGNLMFTPLEKNTTFPKQWLVILYKPSSGYRLLMK